MTKERAIEAATIIAKEQNITMAVANDSLANPPEEPWGYCPNDARHRGGEMKGSLILFPWAEEEIIIEP